MKRGLFLILAALLLGVALAACAPGNQEEQLQQEAEQGITIPSVWRDSVNNFSFNFTGENTVRVEEGLSGTLSIAGLTGPTEIQLQPTVYNFCCEIFEDRLIIYFDAATPADMAQATITEEVPYSLEGDVIRLIWYGTPLDLVLQDAAPANSGATAGKPGLALTVPENQAGGGQPAFREEAFEEEFYESVLAEHIDAHSSEQIKMLADKQSVPHAVFIDENKNLLHRQRDGGVWAAAEVILPATYMKDGWERDSYLYFREALNAAGEFCVVYYNMWDDQLLLAEKKQGQWQSSVIRENPDGPSTPRVSYDFSRAFFAFGSQGQPLVLHRRSGVGSDFTNHSYYLNDIQLTQGVQDETREVYAQHVNQGILPGLLGEIIDPVFTVSPGGTCHLDYFMPDPSYAGEIPYIDKAYKYCFSISADDGKTWQGPFEVRGILTDYATTSVAYDADGTKYIAIYDSRAIAEKLTVASIDAKGKMTVQKLPTTAPIEKMAAAKAGKLYFYGFGNSLFVLEGSALQEIETAGDISVFEYIIQGMLVLDNDEIAIYTVGWENEAFSFFSNRR